MDRKTELSSILSANLHGLKGAIGNPGIKTWKRSLNAFYAAKAAIAHMEPYANELRTMVQEGRVSARKHRADMTVKNALNTLRAAGYEIKGDVE